MSNKVIDIANTLNLINDYNTSGTTSNARISANSNGQLTIHSTQSSTNSSTAALILLNGGLSINITSGSSSFTQGGALTVLGGASVAGTSYLTNIISTNSSVTSLISTSITSSSAFVTNQNSTNITVNTLNATTGITSASALITNQNSTNITASTLNVVTGISSGRLYVLSNGTSINDYGMVALENTGGNGISFGYDTTVNRGWIYSRAVGVAGTTLSINNLLYVQNVAGNVGIGNSTPSTTLDVSGTFRTTSSATIPSLLVTNQNSTNITVGTINVNTGITTGNSLVIGTLNVLNTSGISLISINNIGDVLKIQNSNGAGYSTVQYLDSSGSAKLFFGYGNTGGGTGYANVGYLLTSTSVPFKIITGPSGESSSVVFNASDNSVSIKTTTNSSDTSSGALQISGGVSVVKDSFFGGVLNATNSIITNQSVGVINVSTGITSASALITNQSSTNIVVTNLTASNFLLPPNILTTNITVGTINATTGITSSSALITNQNSTNISAATINISTSITSSTINITGDTSLASNLRFKASSFIGHNTSDGSDDRFTILSGGGSDGANRGGRIVLSGNERGGFGGDVQIFSGTNGNIEFFTNGDNIRASFDVNGLFALQNGLSVTSSTISNQNSTNISTATLNATTGITSASALITNGTISTLRSTNITSASALITNQNSTNITVGNSLIVSSGNIGIGVSPSSNLDIYNASSSTFQLRSSSANTKIYSHDNTITYFQSLGDILFTAIDNPVLRNLCLKTSGNIGIGNTSPSTSLDITGTFKTSSSATIPTLLVTNGVATNITVGTLNVSTGITSATALITNQSSTNITVGTLYSSNIGIGGTPLRPLHVYGNGGANNIFEGTDHVYLQLFVNGSRKSYLGYSNAGSQNLSLINEYTSGNITLGYSAGSFQIQDNAVTRFICTGGNVGIGITNPSYRLHVNGNFQVYNNTNGGNSNLFINSDSGSSAYSILGVTNNIGGAYSFLNSSTRTADGGPNVWTMRNDVGHLRLQAASAVTVFLNTNGNVGIATTSPSTTLDVSGTFKTSSSATIPSLLVTNQNSTNITVGTLNATTGITSASALITNGTISTLRSTNFTSAGLSTDYINFNSPGLIDGSGWWYIGRYNGVVGGTCQIELVGGGGYNGLPNQHASSIIHIRNGNGGGQNASVTYSRYGLSFVLSNVILSSISTGNTSTASSWDLYAELPFFGGRPIIKILNGQNSSFTKTLTSMGSVTMTTDGSITFSASEYFGVKSPSYFLGNIGIGNSAPSSTVDITGTLKTSSFTNMSFNSNTMGPIITTGGSVGIGTNSPQHRLDINTTPIANSVEVQVRNTSFTSSNLRLGVPSASGVIITNAITGGSIIANDYGPLQFGTGTTAGTSTGYMIINTAGNVGIGTTFPSYKLQVQGNFKVNGSILPSYAPLSISSTWEAYGDSITVGLGLSSNQTWPFIVNQSLGGGYINRASSGNHAHDMTTMMYNLRTASTLSSMIFIGTNDIRKQFSTFTSGNAADRPLYQSIGCLETAILFSSLSTSNRINARTGATTTGSWFNTPVYTSIGVGTTTGSSSISATVTGRYVSFTVTGTNPTLSPLYYGERFDLSISNTVLNATGTTGTYSLSNMYTAHEMTGGSFATWSQHTFMFDTENNTTHNITITFSNPSGTDAFYVDWFAGWNSNSTLNNVLVMSIPKWQFRVDFKNDNETKVTDIRRVGFNKSISNLCHTLRTTFFIPVYLVDLSESSFGGLQSDGLHPSYYGQKYIASRVLNVISNGEYNFTN